MELFRLGKNRSGKVELHLRIRCDSGLLEARLTEDGAQGARLALGGTLAEGQLGRLARVMEAQGHEAHLEPRSGHAAGNGREQNPREQPREEPAKGRSAAIPGRASGGRSWGRIDSRLPSRAALARHEERGYLS